MSRPHEIVVDRPDALAECCASLAQHDHFGFDTEFVGEDSYHPHLCLIQVATADHLYLIDPLTVGPLDAFWNLMVDPGREVVAHAAREEVRICQNQAGKPPAQVLDLQLAAGLAGYPYPLSHGALVEQVLGVRLRKGETLTEWRSRPLTHDQIRYAFDDVRHLLAARKRLGEELERQGRMEWVREECDRMVASAVRPSRQDPQAEKWRKLRGLGALDRRKLAVVRELFVWRERAAETANRPPRVLLRDDLIVEIARRSPKHLADLQVTRGLAKRDAPAILEAVERGRALTLEECPELPDWEQDPPQVQWVANVLTSALGDWCVRNRLAGNLVATSSDIKQLVRSVVRDEELPTDILLTQGWRAQHVLPEMLAILEGRRSIRVADPSRENPFDYLDVPESDAAAKPRRRKHRS